MVREFRLTVVTPEKTIVESDVISAIIPGVEGYLGILYGHLPMVVCLRPGILVYREPDSKRHFIAVDGGFAEVQKDRVHVLADGAARSEEIDRTEEERSLETARRALRGEISGMSLEDATFELERAASRLRAARMSTFVGEEIFSG